jgi:hypothetical protein
MSRTCKDLVPRLGAVAAVVLCAIPCLGQRTDKVPPARPPATALKQMLSWLPDDTETVISANGPFSFPDFDLLSRDDPSTSKTTSADLERRMGWLPLGLFWIQERRYFRACEGQNCHACHRGFSTFQAARWAWRNDI